MNNAATVPDGYMQDSQGRLVPDDMVKPIDKARNELVMEIVTKAMPLRQKLAEFRAGSMDDINAFIDLSAEQFGAKIGGAKGNVTLMSYDGRYKIIRAIDDYTVFDERLQIAKSLIDECIHEWSAGARSEIRTLINDAFQVDKEGRVNTKRVLGLRRLDIKDERWKRAMDAIGESLLTVGSKAYLRIYERQADGSYKQLGMDLASAEVA